MWMPKTNTAQTKGRHKTCPYSAQIPRGCHFEQSEKSQTFHFALSTFHFNCIPCGYPKQIPHARQNTARTKGRHKTCPYSAQIPRGCHFERSEKSKILKTLRALKALKKPCKKMESRTWTPFLIRLAFFFRNPQGVTSPRSLRLIAKGSPIAKSYFTSTFLPLTM